MEDFKIHQRRLVSFNEAMGMAMLFQKEGHFEDAANIYRQLMDVDPDDPDLLHFSGILAHQQGNSDEAIRLIERSLEIVPDRPDCYSNLGIIYRDKGEYDKAIAAYQRAIELNPNHGNALNNLGVLLRAMNRTEEAEAAYRKAIAINPEHADAWSNLGILLGATKRTKEAIYCHSKVTVLCPEYREAYRLLAMSYCTLGEYDKAIAVYEKWLEEEPDNPVPKHLLAAVTKQNVPERAADEYIEKSFDSFASTFDAKLSQLLYQAPKIVAALLGDAGVEASKSLDVLDAGCGTGLCGPLLAPYARRLVGVDLSGGMLARARERNVYDDLVKSELTSYIRSAPSSFDVIASADTLVYFGALDDFVAAAAAALRPGGWLLFTVEEAVGVPPDTDYVIATHGRYQHSRPYVERLLREAGMRSFVAHVELRMESGVPVAGLAVRGEAVTT